MVHIVEAVYTGRFIASFDDVLRNAAGVQDYGSGFNLHDGCRDISWALKDKKHARRVAKRVRAAAHNALLEHRGIRSFWVSLRTVGA